MKPTIIRFSEAEYTALRNYSIAIEQDINEVVRSLVRSLPVNGISLNSALTLEDLLRMHRNKTIYCLQEPVVNIEDVMMNYASKDFQLLEVAPGIYEAYIDGSFVACGTYEQIVDALKKTQRTEE